MSNTDQHAHHLISKGSGGPPDTLDAWAAGESGTAVRKVMNAVRA